MASFFEQDGVDQAAVAASGTAAEAFHAEVRGRGAQGKVGHHVGNMPQHPHGICHWSSRTSTESLAGDGLSWKGLLSLVEFESISSNIASTAGIWRRRLWLVMAVSTKVLLIGSRPLAMFAAVAWSRTWVFANVSRKNMFS